MRVLYRRLLPVRFYRTFSTLSDKRYDVQGKKLQNVNVILFSLQLLSEIFLVLKIN
jgi:hypothetical protein